METYQEMNRGPAMFQMGVPATEIFPATLFARIRAHAVRAETSAALVYPDPRGELELRREIAGYLAVSRGIDCSPSQVIITSGFAGGLVALTLQVLGLDGKKAWFEEPGFPFARHGLELARLSLAPIPVDGNGIDVDHGTRTLSGGEARRRHAGTAGAARAYLCRSSGACACSIGRRAKKSG